MSKKLKNNKKNEYWRDFGYKITYVYEVLFKKDKEKLINYFSAPLTLRNKSSRKKTIENWLNGKTKKPNGFHLSNFKISEYKYSNGKLLFPKEAFKLWSIDTFRARVDDYIAQMESQKESSNSLQFIYYFNVNTREINYYTITYPDSKNSSIIHISSPLLTENMTYKGEIFEYHNILYIFAKNDYDHMIYLVENSANVFQESTKVYGIGQCKDFATRQPKAYMALFSATKLTPQEEELYQHKLNGSNLLIAQGFPRHCHQAEDYMFNNFYNKIQTLGEDIFPHYETTTLINKDYNDVMLREFKTYLNVLKKVAQDFDFFITTRRKLQIYSLDTISQDSDFDTGVIIIYSLNHSSLPLFFKMLCNQNESIYLNRVHLRYIIIIQEKEVLTSSVIQKLRELEEKDVDVKLLSKNPSVYSEILITIDTNFALYRIGNQVEDRTFVTKNIHKIDELYEIHTLLEKNALPLQNFLDTQCTLNGKWYSYSYGSKSDTSSFNTVPIEIQNNNIIAFYSTGVSVGKIYKTTEQTLLILDNTVIKLLNHTINEDIFKISIIGKELFIDHRDILLYGIMSREELTSQEVHLLLDAIYIKDEHNFRLKTSDSFDRILAEFKTKKYLLKNL